MGRGIEDTCKWFVPRSRLDLGPWQQIFYTEFDGRRPKRLIIKVLGE